MRSRISYNLDRQSPLYPGTPPVTIEPFRSIDRGDSANNSIITLSSHTGTHIDLPRHFCSSGKTVVEVLEGENAVEPAYCCDIPKKPGESITCEDFLHCSIPENAKVLLVRTGFFHYRSSDQEIYTRRHPWVHPGVPGYLRKRFPDLIVFGLDTISISNPDQRSMGHEAHRSFLCETPPIMLLEDLNLSQENLSGHPWKLTFFPMILDELDGVPIIAFLE